MRYAVAAAVLSFLSLLAIPVLMACALFRLRDAFLDYGRWMMRVGRSILGIGVEIVGLDRIDWKTPCIFFVDGVV